jgi:predicted transport protein
LQHLTVVANHRRHQERAGCTPDPNPREPWRTSLADTQARTRSTATKAQAHPAKKLLVYLKTDPGSITLEPGFTRDVTKIGHYGTGNLEVTIGNRQDFERAQPLIQASYQAS